MVFGFLYNSIYFAFPVFDNVIFPAGQSIFLDIIGNVVGGMSVRTAAQAIGASKDKTQGMLDEAVKKGLLIKKGYKYEIT